MSLRSPLGRVLGLGSAKHGTAHWWGQRVSAVALACLGLWFVVAIISLPGFGHAEVVAFISHPVNALLLMLLSVAMGYHSWLGVQVIIEDYVHAHVLRLVLLFLSRFAHIFLGVAAVFAILKIGLGT